MGAIAGKTKILPDKSIHYMCVLFNDIAAVKIIFIFMLKF